MKKSLYLVAFAVILAVSGAWAEGPPAPPVFPSEAHGTADGVVLWEHGTDTIGGLSGANSLGFFLAEGPCDPSGAADAFNRATGENTFGPNFATSISEALGASKAEASGLQSSVELSGFSEQLNFAEIGGAQNSAAGWGYTNSSYDGAGTSPLSATGFGKAGSKGETEVSISETSNSRQAQARTTDMSFGYVSPGAGVGAETTATGEGAISVLSVIDRTADQGIFAGASGDAYARFNAIDGNFTAGILEDCGITDVLVGPNSVLAKSHVESGVNVSGGMCGGAPCDSMKSVPPELNMSCGSTPCP